MPTFDDAILKAVRSFYEGNGFDNYEKATGSSMKYNIDYFDDLEGSFKKKSADLEKVTAEPEEDDDDDMESGLDFEEDDE